MTWFLVYIYRKYHILCLAPTPSLRRSGVLSLNISEGNGHKLGTDCALLVFFLYICSFLYVAVVHCTFLDFLKQACIDPLWPRPPGLHFFYSLSFFLSVNTLGHLVKWSDVQLYIFFSLYWMSAGRFCLFVSVICHGFCCLTQLAWFLTEGQGTELNCYISIIHKKVWQTRLN